MHVCIVSFNSTIPRAQLLLVISALDLSVHTVRFCSAVFGVMWSLAVIHTIHGRPWLCILYSACILTKTRSLSAINCSIVVRLSHLATGFLTAGIGRPSAMRYKQSPSSVTVYSARPTKRGHEADRSQSQIFVENQDFILPHLYSTPALGGGVPVGILPWRLVPKN